MSTEDDPQRLLAELETARLALQARPKPSRKTGLFIAFLVLLVIGGLALWGVALLAGMMTPEQRSRVYYQPGGEKAVCTNGVSSPKLLA